MTTVQKVLIYTIKLFPESPADNICKRFGHISDPTDFGPNCLCSLMVFLGDTFKTIDLKKNLQATKLQAFPACRVNVTFEHKLPCKKQAKIRSRGYKNFLMLNSAEHEIYPAHEC